MAIPKLSYPRFKFTDADLLLFELDEKKAVPFDLDWFVELTKQKSNASAYVREKILSHLPKSYKSIITLQNIISALKLVSQEEIAKGELLLSKNSREN